MSKFALVASLIVLSVGVSGCTTSRAVRAWHAGIKAEQKGQLTRARRKYAEAYGRNGKLVGAELARLRLMAHQPESRKKATEQLKKLVEKRPDNPQVVVFAAWWALMQGDPQAAADRVTAIRTGGKAAGDDIGRRKRSLVEAIEAQKRRMSHKKDVQAAADQRNAELAVAALNDGEFGRARDLLAAIVARQPNAHWTVRFNLAIAWLHLGDHDKARRQLSQAVAKCAQACSPAQRNLSVLGN